MKKDKLILIPRILLLINDCILLYLLIKDFPNTLWFVFTILFIVISLVTFYRSQMGGILLLLYSVLIFLFYIFVSPAFFDLGSFILIGYIIIAILFIVFSRFPKAKKEQQPPAL